MTEQSCQGGPRRGVEWSPLLEQVQAVGASNSLGAALDSQFAVDVADVALHRADGDDQLPRHRGIRQARHQQP